MARAEDAARLPNFYNNQLKVCELCLIKGGALRACGPQKLRKASLRASRDEPAFRPTNCKALRDTRQGPDWLKSENSSYKR